MVEIEEMDEEICVAFRYRNEILAGRHATEHAKVYRAALNAILEASLQPVASFGDLL